MKTKFGPYFRSDIFTVPSPKMKSVHRPLWREIEGVLDRYYDHIAGKIDGIDQVDSNEINSNNFRIQTESGIYILKRIQGLSLADRKALKTRISLANKARKKRILFPLLHKSATGDYVTKTKKSSWMLMDFIEGAHFDGSESSLYRIGLEEGKLFSFLGKQQLEDRRVLEKRNYFTAGERKIFGMLNTAIEAGKFNSRIPVEYDFIRYWPVYKKHYNELYRLWKGLWDMAPVLCHIDIHPHNVLLTSSGSVFFLDMDSLLYGNRIASIGYSIFKLMRNLVFTKKRSISQARINMIRKKLISFIINGGALKKNEILLLSHGARLEIIKRVLKIGTQYMQGKNTTWAHLLPMHALALTEVRFIYDTN